MRDLGPPKTRRCHFFDNEGRKIYRDGEYGCPRRAYTCHFIHPSDPEWTNSLLSRIDNWRSSPPRSPSSSSASFHGHERRSSFSTDRHPATAESSSKRRRSPPLWSSTHHSDRDPNLVPPSPRRGTSPPRDSRGSSTTSTREVRPLPHRASSNDRPHLYPQPDPPPPKSDSKPSLLKMGSDDHPHGKETRAPSASGSLKSPSLPAAPATFKAPSETASKPPTGSANVPSGPFSEVLPPPSLPRAPIREEMTPAERRAVWEKRVALMADATQEYMDLGKLEKDVESRRLQVQSPAFNSLPSAIRDSFQASLTNATAACERKKASLNKALNKLSETDFWPPIPSQNVGDMESKLAEAKTMLGSLADSVSQLYKRIESLYEGRTSAGPSEGATVAPGSGDGDTTHTKKRRRLSVDGGDTGATDTSTPDMREDVESIRDAIREIEGRLQEMENDLTQHSQHIMEQLEAKMDEKIEEIARNTDISALVGDHKLSSQTAETIQTFQDNFDQADREIAELAQEVGDLIPQLDALQRENDLSKQEEAAEKELLENLVKADQDNAEAIARLQEEAKALRSALTAHAKRALPATPAMPLSAPFMETIKGSIVTQVHEHILPIVAHTRSEMERIAKTRDTELYEKLKEKLDQSLKMSELISTWIESNPDDARQALAAATAGVEAGGDSVVT